MSSAACFRADVRPTLDLLREQALFTSAVQDSALSPAFSVQRSSTIHQELAFWQEPKVNLTAGDPEYTLERGYLTLVNQTEMVYDVPQNTTLVEVLGEVGPDGGSSSECHAVLVPKPSWWIDGNAPRCGPGKEFNRTRQTMFLLPVDPAVKYTLHVGSLRGLGVCPINGVRNYHFH